MGGGESGGGIEQEGISPGSEGPGAHASGPAHVHNLAVLKAKVRIQNRLGPPDLAQNHRSPEENDRTDPPQGPPRGRGPKNKIKNLVKHK